jgi:uncharacterized protein YcbX
MPQLRSITVFPVKSLDGARIKAIDFVGAGGLRHDRRFALQDAAGKFVNGKRFPAIHAVRAEFSPDFAQVTLRAPGRTLETFRLAAGDAALEAWFSDYFGFTVTLAENIETGFPDDLESPGPTLISTATLAEVCRWFPQLDLDEVRRRFRANLEIDSTTGTIDCPAFWEDRLFRDFAVPDARDTAPFRIGAAHLEGVNPCARCAVPTRDSRTGEAITKFAVDFSARRRETLPAWSAVSAFDHYYRLAINTRAAAAVGRTIRIGDDVATLD